MTRTSVVISSLSAMLLGSAVLAQAPLSEIDAHIATAKTAAGQDYRGTFVNLCLPSAPRGGGAGRGAAAGGGAPRRGAAPARGAGAPQTPDRANWYAPPFKVFDNLYWLGTRQHSSWALQTSAGHHHHRHEFRLGHAAGNHRRHDEARPESERHQVRDHQPRAWRPRPGRRGIAGALQRASRDGRARLGRHAQASRRPQRAAYRRGTSRSEPEGRKLTLGDTTIDIVVTPGHTPGTLSYVFPVKDQGRP